MKILLSDVLGCVPSKINVHEDDYVGGTRHPGYRVDLAQAIKWNACVDHMQNNLIRLVKEYNARGEGHTHE